MPGSSPKVLLLMPPYNTQKYRTAESLGIKYLAAVLLQRGIETCAIDAPVTGHSAEHILQMAAVWQPNFIGISVQFTETLDYALDFARQLKDILSGAHLCLGGNVPSTYWSELLPAYLFIDTIVIGEGELTLPELLDHLYQPEDWHAIPGLAYRDGSSCRSTPLRPRITDLDALPFPLRDDPAEFLGAGHYTVVSSRGCPHNCIFCAIPVITSTPGQPRWRSRSPSNVVDELQYLAARRGARTISFADDNFLGSSRAGLERAAGIAREIVRRDLRLAFALECRASDVSLELFTELKQAGLRRAFLGAESGLDTTLALYNKHLTTRQVEMAIETLRSLEIEVECHFIPYHPDVTLEEIEQTFAFMDRLDLATSQGVANRLGIDRDTPVYHQLMQAGRLYRNGWRCSYVFNDWRVEALHWMLSIGLESLNEADYWLTSAGYTYRQAQLLISKKVIEYAWAGLSSLRGMAKPTAVEVRDLGFQMNNEVAGWLLEHTSIPKIDVSALPK